MLHLVVYEKCFECFSENNEYFPGCRNGVGRGNYSNGAGAGAGHGGRGGSGFFSGKLSEGGPRYGSADLPCELGSGTVGPNDSYGYVAGGGMIG